MRLYPRESGYLYPVPDGNFDAKDIKLFVDGDGYSISFNNGAKQEFVQGMKLPGKYLGVKYLIITMYKDDKRYDSDALPMTLVTLVGVPYENLFPRAIADLIFLNKELTEQVKSLRVDVELLKEVGDII